MLPTWHWNQIKIFQIKLWGSFPVCDNGKEGNEYQMSKCIEHKVNKANWKSIKEIRWIFRNKWSSWKETANKDAEACPGMLLAKKGYQTVIMVLQIGKFYNSCIIIKKLGGKDYAIISQVIG